MILQNVKVKAVIPIMAALCIAGLVLEYRLVVKHDAEPTGDYYIFTTLSAVVLFVFFMTFFYKGCKSKLSLVMARIGRDYSTGIYIIHPLVISLFSYITKKMGIFEQTFGTCGALCSFAISLGIVSLCRLINQNRRA